MLLASKGSQTSDQYYRVYKVVTSSDKAFNVMAFKHENVADLKRRIEILECIPII
jgi:hypothetical protein